MGQDGLTESERFPLMTDEGRRLLAALHESDVAPRYNHWCGDRLTQDGLHKVLEFERELRTAANGWGPGDEPAWVPEFAARCLADVPWYRAYRVPAGDFESIPTCERGDLAREPWSFVPDSLPLTDMALYQTSGTTGHPLNIITHPEPLAIYIPLIRAALAERGVTMPARRGQVAIVQVCHQGATWTYFSISPVIDNAGLVKVNLNPGDWQAPEDRARFLDDCHPWIYTGDPISFAELARLPLQTRPLALVSTAMTLLPGLRRELETHFGCPVVDVYSMNETGPMAVARDGEFHLLHHRLYVETLHADGTPCQPGEEGGAQFLLQRRAVRRHPDEDQPAAAGQRGRLQGQPPATLGVKLEVGRVEGQPHRHAVGVEAPAVIGAAQRAAARRLAMDHGETVGADVAKGDHPSLDVLRHQRHRPHPRGDEGVGVGEVGRQAEMEPAGFGRAVLHRGNLRRCGRRPP